MTEVKTDDSRFVEYIGNKKIQGEVFGDWEAIGYLGPKTRKWACRCTTCGIEKDIAQNTLLRGIYAACLHGEALRSKKVKVGDVYGEFTVVGETVNYRALCRCSCGEEKLVNLYHLQAGRSTSCGHTMNQDKVTDLTGQKFNSLTVLRYLGEQKWECRCDCGNITVKHRNKLLAGISKSCKKCLGVHVRDLRGQKFGKLTPLRYVENKSWECLCDCGNVKNIRAATLIDGSTVSCGCLLYTKSKEDILASIAEYTKEKGKKPTLNQLAYKEGEKDKNLSYHLRKKEIRKLGLLDESYVSKEELELRECIIKMTDKEIVYNVRDIIAPYELDIYIPDLKIAIEFNGSYWHSTKNKSMNYHQNKTIACAKLGIQLIHIYEYEWQNYNSRSKALSIIDETINGKTIVESENIEITRIPEDELKEFTGKHSIEDITRYRGIYGITDKRDSQLIGVVIATAEEKDGGYEKVLKIVTKFGVEIQGYMEKLEETLIKDMGKGEFVIYCDIGKYTGNNYLKEEFVLAEHPITKPKHCWAKLNEKMSRDAVIKQILIPNGFDTSSETEDKVMGDLGYFKIYNSGNIKLVYNK